MARTLSSTLTLSLTLSLGGAMIWAANPSPKTNPRGAELCPQVAVGGSTLVVAVVCGSST